MTKEQNVEMLRQRLKRQAENLKKDPVFRSMRTQHRAMTLAVLQVNYLNGYIDAAVDVRKSHDPVQGIATSVEAAEAIVREMGMTVDYSDTEPL
jgi:hypothetical protein